ncbi:kinesin-like protein [Microbotryomycetes sp. JL201]|nr:kinesin-like protein [Microbotryomycetes sp. JL201]
MSFGPGNAFGSFASSVAARPPRRINSSGSFKDQSAEQHRGPTGPTPIDHVAPPVWQDLRQRELSNPSAQATGTGGGHLQRQQHNAHHSNNENVNPLQKPFVYSREFILSLYDPDKASKRPLEMATHDVATSDRPTKPWALQDYRPGEKDLFATTLHPPNARNRTSQQTHRLGSLNNGVADSLSSSSVKDATATQTLDLASLGTLPRERDRQAFPSTSPATPNGTPRGTISATSGITSPVDRSALGALGPSRRTRSGLGSGGTSSMGIVGGVLGGIGAATSATSVRTSAQKSDATAADAKSANARWRRTDTDEDEKRPSAFGSRRFPLTDASGTDHTSPAGSPAHDGSWDHADDAAAQQHVRHESDESGSHQIHSPDAQMQQATSILGSLALDSADDPVVPAAPRQTQTHPQVVAAVDVAPKQATTLTPPPGFEQRPVENLWQYRDPSGQVHEFSAEMMHEWYTQSFFQMDLRVRRSNELEFETLENLIRRTGNIDSPFLTAPPQARPQLPPPNAVPAAAWPATSPSPASFNSSATPQRSNSGFQDESQSGLGAYSGNGSPFGHSLGSQLQQDTRLQAPTDPWAAAAGPSPVSQWDDSVFRAALLGQAAQQSPAASPFQQHQHAPQSAAELLRQLSQGPQRVDTFAQSPSHGVTSPFYNSPAQYSAPDPWSATQHQQAQQQQQSQQQTAIPAQPVWQSRHASLDVAASSPVGTPAISPIGPPQSSRPASAAQSPTLGRAVAPTQAPVSQTPTIANKEGITTTRASEPVSEPEVTATTVKNTTESQEESQPELAPSTAETRGAPTAPWLKEEERMSSPAGPSLREIQEAEAREAEKRKAAARVQAAQANMLAAQRAAIAEAAEQQQQLPASAGWGSPATKSAGAAAPWSKPTAPSVAPGSSKTLKEIQEEEERRKKEHAASQAAAQAQAAAALGHSAPAVALGSGSSWTTIATRTPPKTVAQASGARSVIPGLPVSAVSARAASKIAANAPPAPSVRPAAPAATPVARASTMPSASPSPAAASAPSVAKPSVIRSVSVSGAAAPAAAAQYDIENPPPPSAEFMKWCKDSLKGLTVPMDEFVRMLLSFPLDASADVLEIISDSVYANSSTLDGRRFANEYTSRRKIDAAARYPTLFKHLTNGLAANGYHSGVNGTSAGAGACVSKKTVNMAEALKSQPVAKTPEWSVKVSASTNKKKKTGASGQTIPGLK